MPERQHHDWREPIVQQAVARFAESCRQRNLTRPEAGVLDHSPLIGVAGWKTKLVEKLPKELKGSLPTVEEIEAELAEYPQIAPRAPRRKR